MCVLEINSLKDFCECVEDIRAECVEKIALSSTK